MEPRELAVVALRVLSGWTLGRTPTTVDVNILRAHALAHETDLPPDELACLIVGRTCAKVIHDSQMERKETTLNFRNRKRA